MLSAAIIHEFALAIAAHFTSDLLTTGGEGIRSRLARPATRKAFEEAVAEALSVALSQYPLDEDRRGHYQDLFTNFLTRPAVLESMVSLLDPRPGAAIQTASL